MLKHSYYYLKEKNNAKNNELVIIVIVIYVSTNRADRYVRSDGWTDGGQLIYYYYINYYKNAILWKLCDVRMDGWSFF